MAGTVRREAPVGIDRIEDGVAVALFDLAGSTRNKTTLEVLAALLEELRFYPARESARVNDVPN
jgi:hypothetical protein